MAADVDISPAASLQLERGRDAPLGAECDGDGINFALYSAHAERVELCLFDATGEHETTRLELPSCTDGVWHGRLAGVRAGLIYGYRVHGPYEPARGMRFNANKLLLDPYARELAGRFRWCDEHYGYIPGDAAADLSFDSRDNAHAMLKCRVADAVYAWGDDAAPRTPWADSVIYELHVKGWSKLNTALPPALRGTYAGLAHPASIDYLRRLSVTAVELLPVHEFIDEHPLVRGGLVNYWGYNSIGFFAPTTRYAGGGDPQCEFRDMVKALHAAGIEVILDVVYNHTAEADELGPTLAFRGIDNDSYYRLLDGRRYDNITGCGNTLNLAHPRVRQLVLDSLRWWRSQMHVDGFRFDLASALARGHGGFEPNDAFLDAVRSDQQLAGVKLIAEPWDAATYAIGRFPAGFSEWNDRFRDAARGFWLTRTAGCGEFASRLAGSSDLFHHSGRAPQASINFITAHDGYTMADLVSYQCKHNEANGQNNADGSNHNLSINCGAEGPSTEPDIIALRVRLRRTLLATLALAHGVPMLVAGDECARTQRGNNNAYCQDNPVSWLDWESADRALTEFLARLLALRRREPALRRMRWFDGAPTALGEPDIAWIALTGGEMTHADWEEGTHRCFGFRLGREHTEENAILVLVNGGDTDTGFTLPPAPNGRWLLALDSTRDEAMQSRPNGNTTVPTHGVLIFLSRAGKL